MKHSQTNRTTSYRYTRWVSTWEKSDNVFVRVRRTQSEASAEDLLLSCVSGLQFCNTVWHSHSCGQFSCCSLRGWQSCETTWGNLSERKRKLTKFQWRRSILRLYEVCYAEQTEFCIFPEWILRSCWLLKELNLVLQKWSESLSAAVDMKGPRDQEE